MYEEFGRIVIIGGPRCGKTTFSARLNKPVLHTDDCILDNPFVSGEAIASWLDRPAPWVIEGVTAPLALYSWLNRHSLIDDVSPCDCVLMLWAPMLPLTYEQRSFLDMLNQYWQRIHHELLRRGVEVRSVAFPRMNKRDAANVR